MVRSAAWPLSRPEATVAWTWVEIVMIKKIRNARYALEKGQDLRVLCKGVLRKREV